jgi:hypothetical protein
MKFVQTYEIKKICDVTIILLIYIRMDIPPNTS